MKEVGIPPTSVFVGYGYLQKAGFGGREGRCNLYQSYMVPENHGPPDKIAFAFGDRNAFGSEKVVAF